MGHFTEQLTNFGFGAASSLLNTGLGMALAQSNDRRQIKQQQKLQDMQIMGQKHLTDYNFGKQLEMWKATNYDAQMDELKKAGLNPALMYGMSGGGGSTTNIQPGNVSGANAPVGGREIVDMQGMGMQMQLLQAQKRVLETQADKNEAEAQKTAGVDTQEATTRIDSLLQGIDNARQQYEIQKLDITLKNIENFEKQASQEDRLDYIEYQTKIAMKQLDNVTAEAFINKSTVQQKIDIIRAEAVGAVLRNYLTSAQTKKTHSDIQLNQEQIKQWVQNNMREWDKLDQENKKIQIQKAIGDFNTDPINKFADNISRLIDNIFYITK